MHCIASLARSCGVPAHTARLSFPHWVSGIEAFFFFFFITIDILYHETTTGNQESSLSSPVIQALYPFVFSCARCGSLFIRHESKMSESIGFRGARMRPGISNFMRIYSRKFFLKDSNFWCVHVNVPWPVCAHAIPFRMLWLP